MSELRLDNVSLSFERPQATSRATRVPILANLQLSISSGEFVAIIGRSGSGKTSILNLAAGFLASTSGRVSVDGAAITGPGADRAVVFQDDALFAWLSARENVALPLKLRHLDTARRAARADELLRLVGLGEHSGKSIWQLSGGQRQRVGIARALAADPQFLLMDEPLGALDAMTRERMQELLLDVWGASRAGVLLITHSVEEALFLATRIIVLAPDPGRIVLEREASFGRRYLAGERPRALKADPSFIALREELIEAIGAGDERLVA
ncbi:MAG: ATP-binding cassette domain-containing protein [Hyphomicrobiales bacterium]|nr:MAG: ATP-binding cassette domain-containing protein [Hyphomicrobiales bacterium]